MGRLSSPSYGNLRHPRLVDTEAHALCATIVSPFSRGRGTAGVTAPSPSTPGQGTPDAFRVRTRMLPKTQVMCSSVVFLSIRNYLGFVYNLILLNLS